MATAMMWLLPVIIGLLYGPYISVGYAPKGHPKETKTKSVEKSLIRMLLNRYEQYGVIGRPVNDSKIQVVVAYGLQLFQILDLDENKQILRTNCWGMYVSESYCAHSHGGVKSRLSMATLTGVAYELDAWCALSVEYVNLMNI
ncbi:unnamed protein product [Dicrocoelium dendriticum]|nr:unnamed protein product [Dicrocoelium dendriticum]